MTQRRGMTGHQKAVGDNQTWLTPPHIIESLGAFDLDPASPVGRPWDTARHHYTPDDDGLFLPWFGRVWLNPPYDRRYIDQWLNRLALHDDGVLLMFARTETAAFQRYVLGAAGSILFLAGRITFLDITGKPGDFNGGAPSILAAYGEANVDALDRCGLKGRHVLLNCAPVLVMAVSPNWQSVVRIALVRLNGRGDLSSIYRVVETIAPDKVDKNPHYREKIRQQLQLYFSRITKGQYQL